MAEARKEMVGVLQEAKALVQQPGNDFAWASWHGLEDAVAELDDLIRQVESGKVENPVMLRVIFAPTGPLQELSLDSGWADEFMELANRFDEAYEKMGL